MSHTGNGNQCEERGIWSGLTQEECQMKTCESEGFIMVHSEETCVSWRCQEEHWPSSHSGTSTTGVLKSTSSSSDGMLENISAVCQVIVRANGVVNMPLHVKDV